MGAVALAGCQLPGGNRVEEGTAAVNRLDRGLARFQERAEPGDTVRLERFTRFEWDRVYAFGGYAQYARVNAAVGAEVYSGDGEIDEDAMLLVFTSGKEIAHALEVGAPSLTSPKRPRFARGEAVLEAVRFESHPGTVLRFVGPGRPGEDG